MNLKFIVQQNFAKKTTLTSPYFEFNSWLNDLKCLTIFGFDFRACGINEFCVNSSNKIWTQY